MSEDTVNAPLSFALQEEFDAIVLDLGLPGLSGIEVSTEVATYRGRHTSPDPDSAQQLD